MYKNYFTYYAPLVQVKFGQTEVRVNEEDFFAAITVIAMGDLSQDFSVIVMAMNGTAIGKHALICL